MNNVTMIINNMNIKLRPDNRYEGRLTVNGKRKSFYGGTKAEIKQKAKEYLQKVENGYKDPKKITFNEYAEYWFITYKRGKIEPSSYTRLYQVFNSQIKNTIALILTLGAAASIIFLSEKRTWTWLKKIY